MYQFVGEVHLALMGHVVESGPQRRGHLGTEAKTAMTDLSNLADYSFLKTDENYMKPSRIAWEREQRKVRGDRCNN